MNKLSFTELYNMLDMLNDQIRNETDNNKLIHLLYKHKKVRHTISRKNKEVIKQIKKKLTIKGNIKRLKEPLVIKMGKTYK